MSFRLNWRLKALLPVLAVLLNGLLLFALVTLSLAIAETHIVLAIAGAGAILICGVLVVTLSYVVSRPMIELHDKIGRLRAGDLGVSVGFSDRNDEIGDLGRDFNAMVQQLRESRAEIQRLYRTQISRAEHLATLGELAAGLAHEIRNPLAGIAGVMEIVGRDLPESSPARDVLKDVGGEVLRVNRIVTDLLETARPKPAEYRASDFNATVEHAVNFARRQTGAKAVAVEFSADSQLGPVEHDSAKIHQVLLNLLLNSIQAIDGDGRVRVTVGHKNGSATVIVSDNGRGVAPEHLPNIFRPFYTTKGSGTGLGLSLVKRIVEDHGGEIAMHSEVGRGTEVEFTVPVRHLAAEKL